MSQFKTWQNQKALHKCAHLLDSFLALFLAKGLNNLVSNDFNEIELEFVGRGTTILQQRELGYLCLQGMADTSSSETLCTHVYKRLHRFQNRNSLIKLWMEPWYVWDVSAKYNGKCQVGRPRFNWQTSNNMNFERGNTSASFTFSLVFHVSSGQASNNVKK